MSTFERVSEVVADRLGIDLEIITMDSDLKVDLGADSLDISELLIAFEDTFGVSIPNEAANDLKTVRNVVDYIENNFPDATNA